MERPGPEFLSEQEQVLKKHELEILHKAGFDIVIDKDGKAYEQLRLEIPMILGRIIERSKDPVFKRGYIKDNLYLYPDSAPEYCIKQRWFKTSSPSSDTEGFDKRGVQAMHSIINELRVAPVVAQILKSDEGRALTEQVGLKSLELVAPVAGFLKKDTGQRFVVYDYKDMEPCLGDESVDWKDASVFMELYLGLMRRNGVVPYDVNYEAFFRDKEDPQKGYLIDIEGYHFAEAK